jgi:putative methionine-R-sulfoxide reductase with GAF domain/CHASE3 domain sensor protein
MKRGLTIRLKILLGFFALIMIFVGYGIYNIYIISNNEKSIQNAQNVIDPSFDAIKDFKLMVERSQRLTIGWIYSPQQAEEKDKLKEIHDILYPQVKQNLQALMANWSDTTQKIKVDSVFKEYDDFVLLQKKKVMEVILTIDDQEKNLLEMNTLVENEITPRAKSIIEKLEKVENYKRQEKEKAQSSIIKSFSNLTKQIYVLIGLVTLLGIFIAFTLTNNIVQPINYINKVISQLGKGELPEDKKTKFRRDEIGQIAASVDNLIKGLRSTSQFAENIGKGLYDAEFSPLSENDVLGNALIEMRNNLKKVDEEDFVRNWTSEGLTTFADILRKNNDDINRLADAIISELIKKLKANQGGLFIVTKDESTGEEYLKLEACYAWDKKKYLEQKIYLGDGLTGQAWQEQATIYLTEVPNDYITITSGLGKTNPRSILIVPLKANDEVFGVVEIASISELEKYKIEFVERVGESIASTIATAKNTEQTAKLLEESKMLTEQMKAQEEEMIQNMEELQATQEEMERSQIVALEKDALLNANNLIFYLSRKFSINSANDLASQLLYYAPDEFEGMNISDLFYAEAKFEEMKVNLSRGEYWSGITTIKAKSGDELLVKISAGSLGIGMSNNRYIVIMDNINDIKLLQN